MKALFASVTVIFSVVITGTVRANDGLPYEQKQDVVYAEVHGTGLLMDIFAPTANPNGQSDEEIKQAARAASPLHRVTKPAAAFLLIHGDADQVVPLSHSQKLANAITQAGGSAELIVKPGGGHPWLTLPEEVRVMADWFDKHLGSTTQPAAK